MGVSAFACRETSLGCQWPHPCLLRSQLWPHQPPCSSALVLLHSCLQSFLHSIPLVCRALSQHSTPSTYRLPVAPCSPPPVLVLLLCTDRREPEGVEQSRRGVSLACWEEAERHQWVSGLAVVGDGVWGCCHSLRSRRDLEFSSQS